MKRLRKIWNRIFLAWFCLTRGRKYLQRQHCGCRKSKDAPSNGLQSTEGWDYLLESLNAVGINTEKCVSIDMNIKPRRIRVTANYFIQDKDTAVIGNAIRNFELFEK